MGSVDPMNYDEEGLREVYCLIDAYSKFALAVNGVDAFIEIESC